MPPFLLNWPVDTYGTSMSIYCLYQQSEGFARAIVMYQTAIISLLRASPHGRPQDEAEDLFDPQYLNTINPDPTTRLLTQLRRVNDDAPGIDDIIFLLEDQFREMADPNHFMWGRCPVSSAYYNFLTATGSPGDMSSRTPTTYINVVGPAQRKWDLMNLIYNSMQQRQSQDLIRIVESVINANNDLLPPPSLPRQASSSSTGTTGPVAGSPSGSTAINPAPNEQLRALFGSIITQTQFEDERMRAMLSRSTQ